MKVRDFLFLVVGGFLVISGMILNSVLVSDARAGSHLIELVEYEYKSVFHSSGEITERLNKYAEQGWILHETFKNEKLGSVEYVFHILKRIKQ